MITSSGNTGLSLARQVSRSCVRSSPSKAGYDAWGGYLQGMLGAQPRHEPQIGPELTSLAEDKL